MDWSSQVCGDKPTYHHDVLALQLTLPDSLCGHIAILSWLLCCDVEFFIAVLWGWIFLRLFRPMLCPYATRLVWCL